MCDSSKSSKDEKWFCEYCTYENFQLSLKCTMCKGQKPLLNEDIFRLSPSTQQPISQSQLIEPSSEIFYNNACGITKNDDDDVKTSSSQQHNKWSCSTCTYLNYMKTQKCVQCNTKRTINSRDLNDEIKTLNISENNSITSTTTSLLPSSKPPTPPPPFAINQPQRISLIDSDMVLASNNINSKTPSSPLGTLNSLSGSKSNNSIGGAGPDDTNKLYLGGTKWNCASCTYENWPKSLKCSMCGHLKDNNNAATAISSNIKLIKTPSNERLSKSDQRDLNLINSASIEDIQNSAASNYINTSNTTNTMNLNNKRRNEIISTGNNCDDRRLMRQQQQQQMRRQPSDWYWLNACMGVVENNYAAVEAYLACGGNPGRALTSSEVSLLNRNSAFDVGHTLIHLAIRFHREEMLPGLLSQILPGTSPGIKRVPSYIAPDLASDIRRHFANSLRIRKAPFNCHYVNEHATFALPAEIEELPVAIQEQLNDELLDRDAQKQLEMPPPALNWSLEITARLGSRLMVLWNRSAGDCLLDSAMQATWGVFDRDNVLRRALSDSLHQCGHLFYPRWKEYEMLQAALLHFALEETQWEEDWSTLLSLASQPGSSLEQLHIFALAHILRRPIIVYGVKYVKSFRGEDIGYARFEGLYLPLMWEQSFCIRTPIALGYTRGHFSALVPTESYSRIDSNNRDDNEDVTFLPLMDCEMKLLPIHFLTEQEMGREESIMRQWLDVCVTEGGLLVAQQKLFKRPLLVAQMLEEWLNHYRRIAQVLSGPRRHPQLTQGGYSSDGDTDEE